MGLILPQEIKMQIGSGKKQYFLNKGYTIDKDTKEIIVNVLDLSFGSSCLVSVACDFCGEIHKMEYRQYCKLRSDKYCCPNCLKHKKKQRNINGILEFIEIPYRNRDWLYNEYINKGRCAQDIADECGINSRTLREWISMLNVTGKIEMRTENITKEELTDLYINQMMGSEDISKIYNVSGNTILRLLKKFGISINHSREIGLRYLYQKGGIEKLRKRMKSKAVRIATSCRQRDLDISEFDGFSTTESHRIRNSSEYVEWRKSVMERDDYTCQCCGKRGGDLEAHHIESFSCKPELRFDIDNGITMCVNCHSPGNDNSFHTIYGCKNNNKEQLDEYIRLRSKNLQNN